jgi:hypothetical protein
MNDYGTQFIKKIGPLGAGLILFLSILITIVFFTADLGVPPRHEPLHDTEFYLESFANMTLLATELEQYIFPSFDTEIHAKVSETDDYGLRVIVSVTQEYLGRVREVIQRDFDPILFKFEILPLYYD